MSTKKKCPGCSHESPDTARFCGNCGQAFGNNRCSQCGAANHPSCQFCIFCGAAFGGKTDRSDDEGDNTLQVEMAQRRPITILFCDMVNSTAFVDLLDPEYTRNIVQYFHQICERATTQYGGRITEYLGDGVVAQYTGHETSAERAVRSALEISAMISLSDQTLNQDIGRNLSVRSGIATGMAIVGNYVGTGNLRIESTIGKPPNIAKRLQTIAQPGEVMINDETQKLITGLFVCKDLGWHSLKGFKKTHRVWRVLGEKSVDFRFQASHANLTPIVDRTEPMEILMRRWEDIEQGTGQVVVITGEPGIGKSRIVEEVSRRLTEVPHIHCCYQCSAYHANTALFPAITRISGAAGFQPQDSSEVRIDKLERYVLQSGDHPAEVMPLYAHLLTLPLGQRYRPLELSPAELKRQILQLLVARSMALTENTPTLVQIEDAHWIDPTSLEMMHQLMEMARNHPILLLITTRPEFIPDFLNQSHVTTITLNRLTREYTQELVLQNWLPFSQDDEYLEKIIEHSDGIPLFAEELAKTVAEDLQQMTDSKKNALSPGQLIIPTTLQDSLLSHLDHLPRPARTVAQLGAAIGREFSCDLLAKVMGVDKEEVSRRIDELLQAEVLLSDDNSPNAALLFKHALLRDAAYESLLLNDRVNIHLRIASVIEEQYPAIAQASPEIMAQHLTFGGKHERAARYWLVAGLSSSEKFANKEACSHLNAGLLLLSEMAAGTVRDKLELKLLIALGPVFIVLHGAGAQTTQNNYDRAVTLCEQLPESAEYFAVLWAKWRVSMNFKLDYGLQWTQKLESLANQLNDSGFRLQAHHCQWTTLFHLGELQQAYQHINKGLAEYNEQAHRSHAATYGGHDPRACAYGFSTHVLWLMGYPEQSLIQAGRCYDWAMKLQQTGSILHAIETNLLLFQFRKEPASLRQWAEKLQTICATNGLPEYAGKLDFCHGWIQACEGNTTDGIRLMQAGLATQHEIGTLEDIPLFSDMLAETLALTGSPKKGIEHLDRALQVCESGSYYYWFAEVHRRKGELLWRLKYQDQAIMCFEEALNIAHNQQARMLELRAAMSLARSQTASDQQNKARSRLTHVFDWFTEGLETTDLLDARVLIQSLAEKTAD